MKSSNSKKQIKDEKSIDKQENNKNQEEDKSSSNEPEKEKVLERFIYVTTYNDSNFLEKIKLLFEEINQKAFNLSSPKEIYTHCLTEEERQNLEIDYVSGFQILDNQIRITIIEGLTGKSIQKIKEALPKTQMNTDTKMIFSDSNILFNKRIYSTFDLSLKFIKTRDSIEQILNTFDIYLKSVNYKDIFDAFMNIGSILKAKTLKEITTENLFPEAQGLLMLERKYGDILKEEDLTGIKKEKILKKKYLITTKTLTPTNYKSTQTTKLLYSSNNENNKNNPIFQKLVKNALNISLKNNINENTDKKIAQTEPNMSYNQKLLNIQPKTNASNDIFNTILRKRKINLLNPDELLKKNIEDLTKIRRKIKFEKFWKPDKSEHDPNKKIYYYAIRANHYDEVVNKMREKYLKDKNHFYAYSDYSLALSFPMIDRYRNEEYLNYMENKSKWINKYDFDRYKQPEREKIYFPRIKKEI